MGEEHLQKFCFGVAVGAGTIKFGLFTDNGTLRDRWELKTRLQNNGQYILDDIADSVKQKIREHGLMWQQIVGVGVGVPGPVRRNGIVLQCVNLGWKEMDVVTILSGKLKMPVKVANDANIAALGEMWRGSAQGYKTVVLLELGTEIGGAIIWNGQIVYGHNGAAGEFGHMPLLHDETRTCTCGKIGCLEQGASATGVVRYAKQLLRENMDVSSSMRTIVPLTSKAVFECYAKGDELATQVVVRCTNAIGHAMAHIGCIIDPQIFLIAGGMANAGDLLLDRLREVYRKEVYSAARDTLIERVKLGDNASIYGAARMMLIEI